MDLPHLMMILKSSEVHGLTRTAHILEEELVAHGGVYQLSRPKCNNLLVFQGQYNLVNPEFAACHSHTFLVQGIMILVETPIEETLLDVGGSARMTRPDLNALRKKCAREYGELASSKLQMAGSRCWCSPIVHIKTNRSPVFPDCHDLPMIIACTSSYWHGLNGEIIDLPGYLGCRKSEVETEQSDQGLQEENGCKRTHGKKIGLSGR